MAYLSPNQFSQDDDERKKAAQATSASGAVAGGGNAPAATASPQQEPQGQQGTGFVNAQQFLGANQAGAQALGQGLAAHVQGEASDAQGAIKGVQDAFNGGVGAVPGTPGTTVQAPNTPASAGGTGGSIGRTGIGTHHTNLTTSIPNVSAFTQQTPGTFGANDVTSKVQLTPGVPLAPGQVDQHTPNTTGPVKATPATNTYPNLSATPGYQDASQKAAVASWDSKALTDNSNRFALLQNTYGAPGYTAGQQGWDNMLATQGMGNAGLFLNTQQQVGDPAKQLADANTASGSVQAPTKKPAIQQAPAYAPPKQTGSGQGWWAPAPQARPNPKRKNFNDS